MYAPGIMLANALSQCLEQKGYDFTGTMDSFQLFLLQKNKD